MRAIITMALKFQSLLQTPNQGQGRLSGTDQCDVDSLRIISVWKLPFALQKLHVIAVFKSMRCLFAWTCRDCDVSTVFRESWSCVITHSLALLLFLAFRCSTSDIWIGDFYFFSVTCLPFCIRKSLLRLLNLVNTQLSMNYFVFWAVKCGCPSSSCTCLKNTSVRFYLMLDQSCSPSRSHLWTVAVSAG